MKASVLRIGILGATGYIGSPYRKEIRACHDARIVGLCSRRRDLLEAAGQEDGVPCLTADWREIVHHPEIDLVIVATPDALHHEATLACAEAGKHVVCEKPLGINAAEASEMVAAYRKRPQLAHFVPFWVRYTQAMRRMKALVDQGVLGDVKGILYRWHNPRPLSMPYTWRDDPQLSSAGSIADVGSHAYDTVRWMLGLEACRVLTHADTLSPRAQVGEVNLKEALDWGAAQDPPATVEQHKGGTVDYASIAWEWDDGAVGALVLSHAPYFRRGLAPELELHGTQASLSVDRISGHVTLARQGSSPEIVDTLPDRPTANRFAEYVFPAIRRVLSGETPLDHPDLTDGWKAQCFTDAAAASAQRGAWVELDSEPSCS